MRGSTIGFLLALLASGAQAATYTVNTAADSGTGSLRDAIAAANASCASDTIQFNIAGIPVGSAAVISLTTPLPTITCAGLIIDGTTQPDTNTGSIISGSPLVGEPGTAFAAVPRPDVVITSALNTGHGAPASGISIAADNVTIQGLSIRGFDAGIRTEGDFTGIMLRGNYLGALETAASLAAGDPGGGGTNWSGLRNNNGIHIPKVGNTTGSVGVTISGNVIAWTNARGIYVDGAGGWKDGGLGNGQGYDLTITNNWIERSGQQNQTNGGGATMGFEATSGGGIEIQDTYRPAFTITGNRILGQPGRVPTTFGLMATGSNGIEINNAKRGLSNEAKDAGACTTCQISGNTITDYLHGMVSRAGSGALSTPFSDKDVLDGYTVSQNLFSGNTMGVTSAGNNVTIEGNRVDANFGAGLFVTGANTRVLRNVVTGNAVGVLVGDPIGYLGTRTNSATGMLVEGNTITDNTRAAGVLPNAGVAVVHDATRARITQNMISRNSGLGIDLVPGGVLLSSTLVPGVTPNDTGDVDSGPNRLQNFPVFDPTNGITITGGTITFTGWARPSNLLEFFIVNPDGADPTGFGEGLRYVCSGSSGTTPGAQPANPNGPYPGAGTEGVDASAARFTVTCSVPAWLPTDPIFTATASDEAQNVTSEFSFMRSVKYTPPVVAPTPVPVNSLWLLLGLGALLTILGRSSLLTRRR